MADDESSSTSEESLDVQSVKFDPMKALYSTKIQLSGRKAPIYDNVSKFEAVLSGLSARPKKKDQTVIGKPGECSRRFLPHQGKDRREGDEKLGRNSTTSERRGKSKTADGFVERSARNDTERALNWVNAREDTAPKVVVKKIEGKKETLERHVPQMLLRGEQVAIIQLRGNEITRAPKTSPEYRFLIGRLKQQYKPNVYQTEEPIVPFARTTVPVIQLHTVAKRSESKPSEEWWEERWGKRGGERGKKRKTETEARGPKVGLG
ncbi:hypothetical protein WN48_08923 [Eufriesea mexicana]|uniref:Uncharacterized protein n=1 Tax=Eufriesea mexicana TaxID=516756 RepID=A0A310SGT6_9HYME|nr:hypothetical protein WN48_08923 [Eufriesea mexicana]